MAFSSIAPAGRTAFRSVPNLYVPPIRRAATGDGHPQNVVPIPGQLVQMREAEQSLYGDCDDIRDRVLIDYFDY